MMFMRKSAFRAAASSAFQLQQQQMEMGIFPFLPHFPCFLFLKHHHFLTSTSTKKPSLPKKNDGLVSDNSNNISIDDALASFYRMVRMNPRPSVVEFGKFLGSFAKKKQYSTVVSLCNQMDLLGVTHTVYSLNILINCLCRSKHVDFAVSILGKMFKLGIQPDVITFTTLLNGLCMEGKIKEAVGLFNEMVRRGHEPNVISYNTIINGLCKTDDTSMAVHVFKKMEQHGCKPDVVTYSTIIDSLCKDRLVNDAMEFLSEMLDRGLQPDVVTYSSIVHGFCNLGQLNEATRLFKEMVGKDVMPDTVTFTILVDGLCKEGMVSEARRVFDIMPEKGVEPDVITYNALMDGYCLHHQMNEASKVFEIMVRKGCVPSVQSYNILINGYCKSRRMDEAKSLLAEMSHKALTPDTVTYSTLMQGLCQLGRPQEALNLFKEMCSSGLLPDLTTYSILLDGFCKHGHLDEALKLLKSMQEKKLEPNIVLYNILIEGMFIAGKLVVAKELFSRLFVDGIRPTLQTYNIMIKGLLKEGLSDEAYKLFRKMEDDGFLPDSWSYNVIIQGFLQNRDSSTAVQFIDEMVAKGFSADLSTFQMLLDLESHDEIISRFLRGSSLVSYQRPVAYTIGATNRITKLGMLKGSPDVYLSGPIRKYIEDKGGRFHLRWGCRQILYDRSPDGEILVTGLATSKATDKKVVKADAYVVACDVPGIKRLLPSQWRESKFFDNIYELVGVPVVTVQLRYNGWVTELQDLERSRQLRQASGLDNLLYTPDADFSCFADLALTSPEDYYIEGQGSLLQCVLTPGDPYMSLTNDKIIERVSKQVLALFPSSQGLEVIWSSVVKIAQSLYREGPGKDPFRPDQKTPVKNFFLAGSYTKQDYIDSMEGATLSGRQASAYICDAGEELVALRKKLAAVESQESAKSNTVTDELSLV